MPVGVLTSTRMDGRMYSVTVALFVLLLKDTVTGQVNLPPEFLPGGDMEGFSLREDTPKGNSVYTLRANDPEDTSVEYGLVSEFFAVDKDSGVVTLTSDLDRETKTLVLVTITATDQPVFGQEALKVSLERKVTVLDQNDNSPIFQDLPYMFTVKETTPVEMSVYQDILVTDSDTGSNGDVKLSCDVDTTPEACKKFFLKTERDPVTGAHRGVLLLQEPLDFETASTYIIAIKAEDQGIGQRHTASAIVVAEVEDEQDQVPKFDRPIYTAVVPEGITEELHIASVQVRDGDKGNPRSIVLSIIQDEKNYFSIRNIQSDKVGYNATVVLSGNPIDREDERIRLNGGFYNFKLKATELEDSQPTLDTSVADVLVAILDVNDNAPTFDKKGVNVSIPENLANGSFVPGLDFLVQDADDGVNSHFNLTLSNVNPASASGIFIVTPSEVTNAAVVMVAVANNSALDYEQPEIRKISFTLVATDSGGLSTEVPVFLELTDANDHRPQFLQESYTTTITYGQVPGAVVPLQLNASDSDSGLFGQVMISIFGGSAHLFDVNSLTGEVAVSDCGNTTCLTTPGKYEFVAKAADIGGKFSVAPVKIMVESNSSTVEETSPNETAHSSFGSLNFTNGDYNRTIRETTKEGTVVASVTALSSDPNLPIRYAIVKGAQENFLIDPVEGIITVAPGALLDANTAGYGYVITVEAIQSGHPQQLTATAKVNIAIEDVNNKPPRFSQHSFIGHVAEDAELGDVVLFLSASDPDKNANLKYGMSKMVEVRDHIGNLSSRELNEIPFGINSSTGAITVEVPLSHELAFATTFLVTVEDRAAQTAGQSDTAEVTIITSASSQHSIFWNLPKALVEVTVPEEMATGSLLLTLGQPALGKNHGIVFEKVFGSDPEDYFVVREQSGEVRVGENHVDYESLPDPKLVTIRVAALFQGVVLSNTTIAMTVTDINDNSPTFSQDSYSAVISEAASGVQDILAVSATDKDYPSAFGEIIYELTAGNDKDKFQIDQNTGAISKQSLAILDREEQSSYSLLVTARDNPNDTNDQRSTTVWVHIEVLDVNDNAPFFQSTPYSAIVSESVPEGSAILETRATDADLGTAGQVHYSIVQATDAEGLFAIDSVSGRLLVNQSLRDKGRNSPYFLSVRAQDDGVPPLSSEAKVKITITDLSAQADSPHFIRPLTGETVAIPENEKAEAYVFQVELADYNPFVSPNKRVKFSLLDRGYGGAEKQAFRIDRDTGLITTRIRLDREEREHYTLVVAATRTGSLLQQAYRTLTVTIDDLNDNEPYFPRPVEAEPLEMSIAEEVKFGTSLGVIEATDPDKGDNAVIHYSILDPNGTASVFGINHTADNKGIIYVKGRLDHEQRHSYDLLVKAANPSKEPSDAVNEKPVSYRAEDLSLLKIHVEVEDIDDNPLKFVLSNELLGVRLSVPRQSIVTTVQAVDPDSSDNPIQYNIDKIVFKRENKDEVVENDIFLLDKASGILKTGQDMMRYHDGTFHVTVSAASARNPSSSAQTVVQLQVLQDTEMLKFVFQKSPPEVRRELRNLHRDFQSAVEFLHPVSLQLADTQVYNTDESIADAQSTSLCFQLVGDNLPFDVSEAQAYLDASEKPALRNFYNSYNISDVGPCESGRKPYRMTWVEILIVVIAGCIVFISLLAILLICCLFRTNEEAYSPSYYHNVQADSQMPIYVSQENQQGIPSTLKARKPIVHGSTNRIPYR